MAKLVWDQTGERYYETGVKKGVLYVMDEDGSYGTGEAWNGLTSVSENPTGAEANALYADDIKYLNLISTEEFGCTIGCYTYPDGFKKCNGELDYAPGLTLTAQTRSKFGFSYVTTEGNDVKGTDYGYKIHLVYGCTASPSDKEYSSINDSPEAIELSYEVTTEAPEFDGFKPTAHVVIDSTKANADQLKAVETTLYGDTSTEAKLPTPTELLAMFKA